jgi:hypothetical protein
MLLEKAAQDSTLEVLNVVIQAAKGGDMQAAKILRERGLSVRMSRQESTD